ncbi:MAG: GIY-YIG nuclease family protein [Lachnospiraceae bacterium]|nr:GIY-YIG nuclease family protein [Lachnospiraceae bacterium]
MAAYTYMLECADGTYYTGWTNDLEKRLSAHNAGKGGKYTSVRRPVTLVYYEEFETKQEAMSREWHIKQLTRKQKEELVFNSQVSNNNEMIKM